MIQIDLQNYSSDELLDMQSANDRIKELKKHIFTQQQSEQSRIDAKTRELKLEYGVDVKPVQAENTKLKAELSKITLERDSWKQKYNLYKEELDAIRTDEQKHVELVGEQVVMQQVLTAVCEHLDVTEEGIRSGVRIRTLVVPRQLYAHLCWHNGIRNKEGICDFVNQDRTSFYHSIKCINNMLVSNKGFKEMVDEINEILKVKGEKEIDKQVAEMTELVINV